MLLNLAVKASLPLIAVQTDDPMNVIKVLSSILGVKAQKIPTTKNANGTKTYNLAAIQKGGVYVMRKPSDQMDWEAVYTELAHKDASICVVNPKHMHHAFFDGGWLSTPEELTKELVAAHSGEDEGTPEFDALVSSLSGLSYQSMVNLTLLSQAKAGAFTAEAVRDVRRVFFGNVAGLQQEDTTVPFYAPSAQLTEWLALDGQLFAANAPAALRARGLLLDGPPGTGKTMGAKFIAREMDLPLYRLDIGATMNKYVGESEKGLTQALAQADRCAPCLMLIDEIEKLFSNHSDGGVSTRALSQLLWWLQEHKSRVLTIMTTNKKDALPPELIRPGRIDAQMYLGPLNAKDGFDFMKSVVASYDKVAKLTPTEVKKIHTDIFSKAPDAELSHAALTSAVMAAIKVKYLSANVSTTQKETI